MTALAIPEAIRKHGTLVAIAGVVMLIAGSWLAASAYHATQQVRESSTATRWTERSAFDYAVPIARNNTHWPEGTVLPMGEPAYYRTVSDEIRVNYSWRAEGANDTRGVAAARLYVLVAAQAKDGRNYWTVEHTLAEATAQNATSGIALAGAINLDDLVNEVTTISHELPPGDGSVNWSVRANVTFAVDAGGRHDQGAREDVMPILAADPRFVLPTPDAIRWDQPHTQEIVTVRSQEAGARGVLSDLKIVALFPIGALLVALGAYAASSSADPFEAELRRYRDFVSVVGGIPEHAREPVGVVDVGTLADLVHVAADARTRVILDARTREFFALLPGVTYRYARHSNA